MCPMRPEMEKTKKPKVAGVLNIISGAFGLIWAIGIYIGFSVVSDSGNIPAIASNPGFVPDIILWGAVPTLIISVIALVGGIFAMQRKQWKWVLAGSIAAMFSFIIIGLVAVILVAKSKSEFK